MLRETMGFRRAKAVMLVFDFGGAGTVGYAMAWLKLTNNAREYGNMIWKIENGRNDNVYVTCNPRFAESVKEFVQGIYIHYDVEKDKAITVGKLIDEREIEVGFPVYEYESDADDDDEWQDDMDKAIYNWMSVEA